MKVLISGCREKWLNEKQSRRAVCLLKARLEALQKRFGSRLHIWTGGATGVDTYARRVCAQLSIRYDEIKPDYDRYGRRAPLVRDEQLVDRCHHVIGFSNGTSPGTLHTLKYALDRRVSHEVYFVNGRVLDMDPAEAVQQEATRYELANAADCKGAFLPGMLDE